MSNFQKARYYPGPPKRNTAGRVSVSKSGRIGLSKQFVREHQVGATDRANLYWDEETRALAFTFVPSSEWGSYPVMPVRTYEVRAIVAKQHFTSIGLNPAEYANHYEYKVLSAADGKVFVVHLD